ncbi:MAG: hypothetical protein ACREA7_09695 [Nitrosotalea sp.]
MSQENNVHKLCCSILKYLNIETEYVAQYDLMFFKNKTLPLIFAFTFILSGLEYGSTTAWAQEPNPGMGQAMPGGNPTGSEIHNPCFPNAGNGTRMHHFGNMTGSFTTHPYGRNGTMGNGMHHFGQYGNRTGFKMHPCTSQNSTQGNNSGNSAVTQGSMANSPSTTSQIPSWVRNNAKWWSQNQLGDSDFIQGVQYLIQQGIMKIPTTQIAQSSSSSSQPIPAWVKTNAGWWANGQVSDGDFIKGIQYLVSSGIIKVT